MDWILARIEANWAVIQSAPETVVVLIFIAFVICWFFVTYTNKTTISGKNATIEAQQATLHFYEKEGEVRRVQGVATMDAQASSDAQEKSKEELDALTLRDGRPSVHEVFLQLTDTGSLNLKWNPMENISKDELLPENDAEIERMAAIRVLLDRGLISGIAELGLFRFSATASDYAEQVRRVYDNLPPRN